MVYLGRELVDWVQISGMGTKIQSKTYLPGCYPNMDVNTSNGMWALYGKDKNLNNGLLNNSFLASSTMTRYIGYDKERVKQTILKHESEFRNQLQELHRLYRIQTGLMSELKRKGFQEHPSSADKSKCNLYLAEAREVKTISSHLSNLPLPHSTFGESPASVAGSSQPHLSFIKGKSTTCDLVSFSNRVRLEEYKPKCNSFAREMIDLEVPAEVCNTERKELGEKFCGANVIKNLNSSSNGDASMSKKNLKRPHDLADLNKPIWVEETSAKGSVDNVVSSTSLGKDVDKWNLFAGSNSGSRFWSTELSRSCLDGRNGTIVLHNGHLEGERNGNGQFTNESKAGKSRCDDYSSFNGSSGERQSALFKSLQAEPGKSQEALEFTPSDNSKSAPKRNRTIFGVEISEGNNTKPVDIPHKSNMHPLGQQSDGINSELTCIAPWRKTSNALSQNVVSFQDTPGLRTFASFAVSPPNSRIQLSEFSGGKMHTSNNSRSVTSSEVFHQNGLGFGSQPGEKPLQLFASSHMEKHCRGGEQIKGKESIYQMNLESLQSRSQHFFGNTKPMKVPFDDFTSPLCVTESGSSTKLLGFSISNVHCLSNDMNAPKCSSKPTHNTSTLNSDGTLKESVTENGGQNYVSIRPQIDLNLSLNEEEAPVEPSLPIASVNIDTKERDLEAPTVLESHKDVCNEADHVEKENETCLNLSDDSKDQLEEHDRSAAEAIIKISLSLFDGVDPVCLSPTDGLLLLAEALSYEGDEGKATKDLKAGHDEETVPEGMDEFEFMTLKLQDNNKEEEYCYKPWVLENSNDEETGVSSMPKRPRKGQAKRRKDFQRDVLPGIVSLSRREVTEDLQTIEEMFKASGETWQSSISRRRSSNSRGRRRSGGLASSEIPAAVSPPPAAVQQPVRRELELEDKNLTGWGKKTRRLPRQRCSSIASNFSLSLRC